MANKLLTRGEFEHEVHALFTKAYARILDREIMAIRRETPPNPYDLPAVHKAAKKLKSRSK